MDRMPPINLLAEYMYRKSENKNIVFPLIGAENFLRSYLRFYSGKLISLNSLFTRLLVKAVKIRLSLRIRHNAGFHTFLHHEGVAQSIREKRELTTFLV